MHIKASRLSRSELDIMSREYAPGDDRRFINWNQTARTGTLMTRLFTGSDHQEIAMITDTFRSSEEQSEFLPPENKILETTLALCYFFSRNNICAAEYHLDRELIRLTVENTYKFEEFYNNISEIMFNNINTHQLLYDAVMRRRDIFDSSMVFLILSSWDRMTDALVTELERNELPTVVCIISDNKENVPDLSHHKICDLIILSPYEELVKELGE